MKLDKIITLANSSVKLQFLAMERSLRASGSDLPIQVIPYDKQLFKLPEKSSWWEVQEITAWIGRNKAHPMMKKYQCLTVSNYQFVDTDICFIQNPEKILEKELGFITCCGHWHNIEHACNDHLVKFLSAKSTSWQKSLFNAGQFASDRILYSTENLIKTASQEEYRETALLWPHNDQPGLNLLVSLSGCPYTNLTLPPVSLESSWAGDYPGEYDTYWRDPLKKPYLIHWAGLLPDGERKIDKLFLEHLTRSEREEWDMLSRKGKLQKNCSLLRKVKNKISNAINAL